MSRAFLNVPEISKFFPRLKTLANNPAPRCPLCFLCRIGPIVLLFIFLLWNLKVNFFCSPFHILLKKTVCLVMSLAVSLFVWIIFWFYTYLLHLRLLPANNFFMTAPPNVSNIGAANALTGKKPLFVYVFSSTTYTPNTTSYCLFCHSKKSSSSCTLLYVLWRKVSPSRDKTYKYLPSEYAHIVNFFVATVSNWMDRFILESFLSNFSISVVYPALALKSTYILSSLVFPS